MSKPRLGRPPVAPGAAKSSMFCVRFTAEERAAIDTAAEREGVTASKWARMILLDAAGR